MVERTLNDTDFQWRTSIDHTDRDGVICVRFRDRRMVDTHQIEAAWDEVSQLTSANGSRLVLNLSAVEFLSSAALNKLVSLERKLRGRDGQLALCSLTGTVRDVFSITRLTQVFDVHATEDEAVESLTRGRPPK